MKLEIKDKKKNPLMKREEVMVSIEHAGKATPNRRHVLDELSKLLNAGKDNIIIDRIMTSGGRAQSEARVLAYSKKQDIPEWRLKMMEQRMSKKKKEAPEEKPAEKPPEEAPAKAEEKPPEAEEATPKEGVGEESPEKEQAEQAVEGGEEKKEAEQPAPEGEPEKAGEGGEAPQTEEKKE